MQHRPLSGSQEWLKLDICISVLPGVVVMVSVSVRVGVSVRGSVVRCLVSNSGQNLIFL